MTIHTENSVSRKMTTTPTVMKKNNLLQLLFLASVFFASVVSAEQNQSIPEGYYSPSRGGKFFLLSDSGFSSAEQARVRLETSDSSGVYSYGGVDVRVYRIANPMEFLKQQKNLHRIQPDVNFKGEGLSNTLSFLWDNWYKKSRRAMQRVFSYDLRKTVTEQTPELKLGTAITNPPAFEQQPQFDPIPGLPLVSQFRYPVADAKVIQPPANVALNGSSSNFIAPTAGNIYIPLGKQAPGLYLVEAFVGTFRATTMVFVSDTIAVTKIASKELFVWTANKTTGAAVPSTQIAWTDGVGVLSSGKTDSDGALRLTHTSSERSYVLGEDSHGGVFISENFYYDSEIYNSKMYAFTDRPLYRPGDSVELKIVGREFKNARDSVSPKSGPIALTVIDAAGTSLQTINLNFDGVRGADTRFTLPDNAVAGGYEIRFTYDNQVYSSAFRVAEYVKPHFEIAMNLEKTDYRTGEAVEGELHLVYPDGKPVQSARIELTLRSQQLSMVDSELQYLGQFPVQLKAMELVTDDNGIAKLSLPAADKPSRYVLTVFASDGAAFRVKNTKEILIERGATQYQIAAPQRFSALGTAVTFTYKAVGDVKAENAPTHFEWVRLEDQTRGSGDLTPASDSFQLTLQKPGSYTINLKDKNNLIVAGTSHSVSGPDMKAPIGSIEVIFDKTLYQPNETATALVTFPEPVADALLTLERDRVEQSALLSQSASWLKSTKINETQYQIAIPVSELFAPNITFSVLYTLHNDFSFQNAGIKVAMPMIAVDVKADKEVYKPGDTVNLDVQTTFGGQPLSSMVTLSVVDEMIYALQPEIAPSIDDFFYHPRRNNVRTTASLSFISYDVALPQTESQSRQASRSERAVKLLERPRRDDVDTALWKPTIITDQQGVAHISFVMPDSLTRWRVTARAMTADGRVGQRKTFLRSDMAMYLKWSGPTRFRMQDKPALGLLAFNNQKQTVTADFAVNLADQSEHKTVELKPGVNYLTVPEKIAFASGDLVASLAQTNDAKDSLSVNLRSVPSRWQDQHTLNVDIKERVTPLTLPADANAIDLHMSTGISSLFYAALDDLLEYPYGCVEQTASRLLPLSVAYPHLGDVSPSVRDRLKQMMQFSRLRLIHMAGPNATFTWWGNGTDPDAFLTGYAYYADWYASRVQGIDLPKEHWQRVLDVYASKAQTTPLLQRALIIDFAEHMQLPVNTLLQGLMEDLAKVGNGETLKGSGDDLSVIFAAPDSSLGLAAARVITARLAASQNLPLPPAFSASLSDAQVILESNHSLFADAVKLFRQPFDAERSRALFSAISPQHPTLERALALTWLSDASSKVESNIQEAPLGDWQTVVSLTGKNAYHWKGKAQPTQVEFANDPQQTLFATLNYSSESAPISKGAPVEITRQLQKLMQGEKNLTFEGKVVSDGKIDGDALYLDEIILKTTAEKPLRYGIVEIPLPPGADVEKTTWGIEIKRAGEEQAVALEKAQNETGQLLYAVPLDNFSGEIHLRHLVRFSQKGQFTLPPVRYRHMYDSAKTAYEKNTTYQQVRVE